MTSMQDRAASIGSSTSRGMVMGGFVRNAWYMFAWSRSCSHPVKPEAIAAVKATQLAKAAHSVERAASKAPNPPMIKMIR